MQAEVSRDFERCLQGAPPPCTLRCPVGLNLREFLSKLQRGSFGPAYNLLRSAVVFPEIVCRICPAPCVGSCKEHLAIPMLERAAIDFARNKTPSHYTIPKQEKHVAVVGAGLGGLACALRLREKQYDVTLYDAQDFPGGDLSHTIPREVITEELKLQFRYAPCRYLAGHRVDDPTELAKQYDAVFLSHGENSADLPENVFSVRPTSGAMEELAAGLESYQQILWYLQTGTRKSPSEETGDGISPASGHASEPMTAYSKAEARQEATRCTGCNCTACVDSCVLLRQYGQSPLDLARDIGVSTNLFHETQGHAAMREIGSCSNCGLCKAVCPVGIDIGKMMMDARRVLHEKRELPEAHHAYWLRDMAFSDSPEASCYIPPQNSGYLFFPGCQAGGSDQRYVEATYGQLRQLYPGCGLLLRCCGAPALWAGEYELFQSSLRQIQTCWETAGRPTLILTCPSCMRTLSEQLPHIHLVMLYEIEELIPSGLCCYSKASVFDPCAARNRPELHNAVRRIVENCGVEQEELSSSGAAAQCCSWGGHGYCVNQLYTNGQIEQQCRQSDLPYICYCTNCRDIFAARGKDCRHILDYILGINETFRPAPTVSRRRENRRALRRTLGQLYGLEPFYGEVLPDMVLYISESVADKISQELILEEDIKQVIDLAEQTGAYLEDAQSGHRIAHRKLGYLTYWVEFSPREQGYQIFNAYSHRMTIKGEEGEPWN